MARKLTIMFGECWTFAVAVLVLHIAADLPSPYPVTVAIFLELDNTEIDITYQQAMPALDFANATLYWHITNYTLVYLNISCDGNGTAALAAELHCTTPVNYFIGPACTKALDAILPLAQSWGIPVISPVGLGIWDPAKYNMLTKLTPYSVMSYAKAMVYILKKYSWKNIAIIYESVSTKASTIGDGLYEVLNDDGLFSPKKHLLTGEAYGPEELNSILKKASTESRVFVVVCSSHQIKQLMLQAHSLGYATSGEYVFFHLNDDLSKIPDRDFWELGNADDQAFHEALGQVILPYIKVYEDWSFNFVEVLVKISRDKYNYHYNETQQPSPYLPGYADALWVLDYALEHVINDRKDPLNGTNIMDYIWNQTFYGVSSPININEEGYKQYNVTFGFFNLTSGDLEIGGLFDFAKNGKDDSDSNTFPWPYNNGDPPLDEPICGYTRNRCPSVTILPPFSNTLIGTIAGLLGVVLVMVIIGILVVYRNRKKKRDAELWWWKIPSSGLVMTARNEFSSMYLSRSRHSLRRVSALDNHSSASELADNNIAIWKGQTVSLRRVEIKQATITKTLLAEFKQLKDVNHGNLARVFGACFEDSLKALVTECCIKGSLQDLLGNTKITLDAQFKSSLCKDIINGLCYLHQSPIHQHGRLNSNVCLIDNRFSVKLTDFGLPTLYSNVFMDVNSDEYKIECKWKAPEILRGGAAAAGTQEADIYSYGMVLLEIITQDCPFATESAYMTTDEILQKVCNGCDPPFRPAIELPVTFSKLNELVYSCWNESPKLRPTCQSVRSSIKKISMALGDSGNLLENLMRRMELYANNLEEMVEEKTVELREEKKKSEELLYQILPRSVADKLKAGLRVDPQIYEGVSIYFSDIVGFTEISAVSSPMEVVDLLNDIYSCFDTIIEEFDVYKVETIGDAYMVVSGLPQRNGNLHALNIARMSIKVLETIREFKIRHMPTESVQLRIGLHSGPVCAGVVGSKMPRYCLFGDTVNTASRMESSGKAMMIHISPDIKKLLDEFCSFKVTPRGDIAVKGKGNMFTYWLLASQDEHTPSPAVDTEML